MLVIWLCIENVYRECNNNNQTFYTCQYAFLNSTFKIILLTRVFSCGFYLDNEIYWLVMIIQRAWSCFRTLNHINSFCRGGLMNVLLTLLSKLKSDYELCLGAHCSRFQLYQRNAVRVLYRNHQSFFEW